MREEEIIKEVNRAIYRLKEITDDEWFFEMDKQCLQAIQGLLDLYQKEKEKNEELKEKYKRLIKANDNLKSTKRIKTYKDVEKFFIPKSKVRELQDKYKNKIEKLESKKIWNEPVDTIIKNRYTNYYNAYEELLEERN